MKALPFIALLIFLTSEAKTDGALILQLLVALVTLLIITNKTKQIRL